MAHFISFYFFINLLRAAFSSASICFIFLSKTSTSSVSLRSFSPHSLEIYCSRCFLCSYCLSSPPTFCCRSSIFLILFFTIASRLSTSSQECKSDFRQILVSFWRIASYLDFLISRLAFIFFSISYLILTGTWALSKVSWMIELLLLRVLRICNAPCSPIWLSEISRFKIVLLFRSA